MTRMGWVLGNAGCGVLIWPGWVGCYVTLGEPMLDVGFWYGQDGLGVGVMLDLGF